MAYHVLLTFDFDAYSPWIWRKMTNYTNLSRGEFASVGVKRILRLLQREGIRATFFIPGHTAEHFSEDVGSIKDEGHEIAHHGYLHEPPESLGSREEEERVISRGLEALSRAAGVRPLGYRSPSWALTRHTLSILEQKGFLYDSSLMGNDYMPYRPNLYLEILENGRVVKGPVSKLVELPVSWSLDDYPHFEYTRFPSYIQQGLRSVSEVFENWSLDFEYMVRNLESGVYVLTMHPEVIGRGHRMILLEKLVSFIKGHESYRKKMVEFSTCLEALKRLGL